MPLNVDGIQPCPVPTPPNKTNDVFLRWETIEKPSQIIHDFRKRQFYPSPDLVMRHGEYTQGKICTSLYQ
jgi:hypothetical protein